MYLFSLCYVVSVLILSYYVLGKAVSMLHIEPHCWFVSIVHVYMEKYIYTYIFIQLDCLIWFCKKIPTKHFLAIGIMCLYVC